MVAARPAGVCGKCVGCGSNPSTEGVRRRRVDSQSGPTVIGHIDDDLTEQWHVKHLPDE
jgi:hypothetical protein